MCEGNQVRHCPLRLVWVNPLKRKVLTWRLSGAVDAEGTFSLRLALILRTTCRVYSVTHPAQPRVFVDWMVVRFFFMER